MVEHSRYNVSDKKADLDGDILKNKLNITDEQKLEDTETLLLSDAYEYFFQLLNKREVKFNLSLLFKIHYYFLSTLYLWAGKIRTVNISKDDVLFTPVVYINKSLKEFEKILQKNLPKEKDNKKVIAKKLATIHCEFNVIHPFRDGNGRTIRLFLDLLASHCKYQIINYDKATKKSYIKACQSGMSKNYDEMCKIIHKGLKN